MDRHTPSVGRMFAEAHPAFTQLATQCDGTATKRERIAVFLEIARCVPPVATQDQAKRLVDEILTAVEDEFSGVPNRPDDGLADGRMYPAHEKFRRPSENPKMSIYAHLGHISIFGINGSFRIVAKGKGQFPEQILLDREGDDGRKIDDLKD
jgi:hypothetical protein